ncbi:L,D-transpeptidase [Streptomyces sp. NBC_00237]|uniref:L,D-transpeptidase n=1 Tax=Streptomyces sp. NBC_00237 TaxID=2975687 RepID=UPI00225BE389|nr:L,D-transpeptidase [Streptomyces sp. NBC_00237]MCX5204794.1 L,D-transpeptidase [Streptomyces sp. NBC_00237]
MKRAPLARITAAAGIAAVAITVAPTTAFAAAAPGAVPVASSAAEEPCTAPTGPYQKELERKLKLKVDGKQSAADCVAIRKLQQQLNIDPADGRATAMTHGLLLVREARKNPNAAGQCPVRRYSVTCVDLRRQLLWVQVGRKVTFAPVPIRSGIRGLETRVGWHKVYWRHKNHFSTIYNNAPMPYSQFFSGGQALHGTYGDLFEAGSGGCVNLYVEDAERLWKQLGVGSNLYVWGAKPGTNVRRGIQDNHHLTDDELIVRTFGGENIPITWNLNTPITPTAG